MLVTGYWAEPLLDRERTPLFSPTLDSVIDEDDPVRLVDGVLAEVDWSDWEAHYNGHRGQPPIHPRYIASAILYGMYRGIRSSRKLEEACTYRFDFVWLVEGRHIDHTKFATFRTQFRQPLKNLFRQIGHIAMSLGLIRLGVVGFDGTRVKANNNRYKTLTAQTLEEKLQALDDLFEHLVSELQDHDARQAGPDSPRHLPSALAEAQERRAQLAQALAQAQEADATRRKKGLDPDRNPAQVPATDADSKVMPNKEGGYAPNYTPVVTVDGHCGMIVDAEVLAEVNESSAAVASVDRIQENFGARPEKFLTDAGNNGGLVMAELEERGVEFYAPAKSHAPQPGDAADREDASQPVPPSQWSGLKRNRQGQLDKSTFIYSAEADKYFCPLGQILSFEKTKPVQRGGVGVQLRIYRCERCAGCPLAAACVSERNQRGRTITREAHEEVHERTAARMSTPEARQLYRQRPRIAETPFAILKSIMGLRQFLLRGLENVNTEWLWAVTAFNLMKLVRALGSLRAECAALTISEVK